MSNRATQRNRITNPEGGGFGLAGVVAFFFAALRTAIRTSHFTL